MRLPTIPDLRQSHVFRHALFAGSLFASVLIFHTSISTLFTFALAKDYGTHITFVVPLSLYFLYLQRKKLSLDLPSRPLRGLALLLASAAFGVAVFRGCASPNCLSLKILTLVSIWISTFILIYGTKEFAKARFALLLLFLIIPIPDFLIDKAVFWLQGGSAAVADWLLHIFGIPVMREGFVLHLPALDLEVEKECSGIRSSLVLFLTTLVVGQFTLRTAWAKCLLVLSIIPIVVLKNGIRIVSIATLTIFVNRAFLHGWLHRSGGIVFYLLGLLALYPVLAGLRQLENRTAAKGETI